jgi:hypothetical protein
MTTSHTANAKGQIIVTIFAWPGMRVQITRKIASPAKNKPHTRT